MTDTYTNARSCAKGKEGDGLNVAWRQAFHRGHSSTQNWTHLGMMDYQTDDEQNLRDRVHFARVYGVPSAFGNLGRQDHVFLQHDKKNGKHRFQMRVWKNTGEGGTKLVADGDKYCNPSCGMSDSEGDDPEGVVDPKLPVLPSEPGDGDSEPNPDDWRSKTCTDDAVTDHTMYGPDRWKGLDGNGAWASVIEGWQYNLTHGRLEKHFANNFCTTPFTSVDETLTLVGIQLLQRPYGCLLRGL